MGTPSDKPENQIESESCMEQHIGEVESSTGQGTAYVENVYHVEEMPEAATSMDMKADKGVDKDEFSLTRGHKFVSTRANGCCEADEAVAHCPLANKAD